MTSYEITTLVLSALAFIFSIITYIKGLARQKKQDTIDAFNLLQEQVLDRMNHYTKGELEEIAKHRRSDEYKEAAALLARCEHFAVGVNSDIYDEKTVRRLAGKHLIYLYEKCLPIIESKRKIPDDDTPYDELEKLCKKMKKTP